MCATNIPIMRNRALNKLLNHPLKTVYAFISLTLITSYINQKLLLRFA